MTFGKHTHGNPIIHWGTNESKLIIGNYFSIGDYHTKINELTENWLNHH